MTTMEKADMEKTEDMASPGKAGLTENLRIQQEERDHQEGTTNLDTGKVERAKEAKVFLRARARKAKKVAVRVMAGKVTGKAEEERNRTKNIQDRKVLS